MIEVGPRITEWKEGEREWKHLEWTLSEGKANIIHDGSVSRKIISHIEILTLIFKYVGFHPSYSQLENKTRKNGKDVKFCLFTLTNCIVNSVWQCSLILCNEYSGIQFQAKTYLISLLLRWRYGITLQTLKTAGEIGITRLVSAWPVNLFTGETTHLYEVLTGFQKSTFFG